MPALAMLLKSYAADRTYAGRLVESFRRHNTDGLTLHVVIPAADRQDFAALRGENIHLIEEEELGAHLVTEPMAGLRTGYVNQEIVKLAFWELGLADNYFTVDSDALFIRDFTHRDFMRDLTTPFTVLVEDRELKVEPRYWREQWIGREKALRCIQQSIGLDDPIIRTCHGHQILSSAVLGSFRDEFLKPRGWGYADAIAEAPYEYSWYCMWLQKARTIPIHAIEPLVKVFHNEDQHLEYILRGVTVEDMARGYLGVVVNSNYSRDLGLVRVNAPKPEALSPYLSYAEVAALIRAKARDTVRRRLGR